MLSGGTIRFKRMSVKRKSVQKEVALEEALWLGYAEKMTWAPCLPELYTCEMKDCSSTV